MMKPEKMKHKSDDEVGARDEVSQTQNPNENLVTIASFNDADSDLDSPHHLSDVPIKYSLSPLEVLVAIKDHIFHNHHDTLDSIPDQAAQVENEGLLHSNDSSLPDISTPSATRSMSSSTSTSHQYLSVADNKVLTGVLGKEKQNPVNHNSLSIVPVSKKTSPDGYNWRKYGEKKLKSPEGSRSYYRCTHCNCYAKKIECSDRNNHVIDTIYKSQHNHDPPNKVSPSPKIRPPTINGHSKTSNSSTAPNNAVASIFLKTYAERRSSASSSKEQCRDGSDDKSEINVVDEDSDTDTDTDTDTDEVELRKRRAY
ncbi:hypothetical protein Leryth_010324 [Lithospermum erythrorhizon]|nr:hypothetical protein Leryth_010324 [Lithospermum erythrorhizon]